MNYAGLSIAVEALGIIHCILNYLAEKEVAMPIQVERDLKMPRYMVFGSLIILEELGLVKPIAKRADWKLYRITEKGRELLEKGKTIIELEPTGQESS